MIDSRDIVELLLTGGEHAIYHNYKHNQKA